jgi:hypothetical protein
MLKRETRRALERFDGSLTIINLRGQTMATKRICSINECGNNHVARGFCQLHYRDARRSGRFETINKRARNGEPAKFLDIAQHHPEGGCLIWPFARDSHGYARYGKHLATRIICARVHGAPPSDRHEAAHSCSKGHLGCVSGAHLSWKTSIENHADKLLTGISNRGENHGAAKLKTEEVLQILAEYRRGNGPALAKKFGVHVSTIYQIVKRKAWAWL